MSIGIIGSGTLGANLARAMAKKGIPAVISNSRGPGSLAGLIQELGGPITAGTVAEALKADIVVLAVPWIALEDVLSNVADWNGRIVIDGVNPVLFLQPDAPELRDPTNVLAKYGIAAVDLEGRHSSTVVSELVPGARVVKAFNHLEVQILPHPEVADGQRVLFYTGDDMDAKSEVRTLIETLGFMAIDLGMLDVGGPLISLPFGPLATHNFVRIQGIVV